MVRCRKSERLACRVVNVSLSLMRIVGFVLVAVDLEVSVHVVRDDGRRLVGGIVSGLARLFVGGLVRLSVG